MRKSRTVRMGVRECGGCDHCCRAAVTRVQVSTPNGKSYRTAGLLCSEHKTQENIDWIVRLAIEYLEA